MHCNTLSVLLCICTLYLNNVYCHALIDIEARKCTAIKTPPPSPPVQTRDVLFQSASEFGKAMSELTVILQSADHALLRMLIAFEQMAHYIEDRKYIAIVQSKEYKEVNSVRALFQLLAPLWKPVDCSLLKELVEAAGVEQAIQRLNKYLHMSNRCLLGNSSEKVYVPHDRESWSHIDSKALVQHDSTSDVVSSQPAAVVDSTSVPVTTVIEAEEMSWGAFRSIHSLLCGLWRVPSSALQYDDKNPGSVVVKCITSSKMLSQIRSTLPDYGDMLLLLHNKIVSIQAGKDYTVVVGSHDYWMVSNNRSPRIMLNYMPLYDRT